MIGWLILIVLVAGFVLSVVPITRWYLREMAASDGDAVDGILFSVMGVLTALFWPIILAGWFVYTKAIKPTVKPDKP